MYPRRSGVAQNGCAEKLDMHIIGSIFMQVNKCTFKCAKEEMHTWMCIFEVYCSYQFDESLFKAFNMNPESTAPLLFVNVDGVLTSARTYWKKNKQKSGESKGPGTEVLDPVALRLLEEFCARMGAEVVMASAWSHFMYKSPDAWRRMFADQGVVIPVVQMLDRPNGVSWAEAMDTMMQLFPNRPHVLFEDDPEEAGHPNLIEVDARVGLSTVNLEAAANLLAPGGEVAKDLANVNRSFSRDATITVGFNGVSVSAHPRDLVKALDNLGAFPPASE